MNPIHTALIAYIRDETAEEDGKLGTKISSMSDEQMIRMMFSSFRGRKDARGMRLTNMGLTIMQSYFRGVEIDLREEMLPLHILYLDSKATMPYHFSGKRMIIYDYTLGIKLKLADGRVATLIEIESEE